MEKEFAVWRHLLSPSQGTFPPIVLTFVGEEDRRYPSGPMHRVYQEFQKKSLNREKETVNLNKEKLKPKGENKVQRFTKTCGKKSTYEAPFPVLKSSRHFFAAMNALIPFLLGS